MFGWEFPPEVSGGLGVATAGIVRGLLASGARVLLVLPERESAASSDEFRSDERESARVDGEGDSEESPRPLSVRFLTTDLRPYPEEAESVAAPGAGHGAAESGARSASYGRNVASAVLRFAERASAIALRERFDVIHAHDWMTFPAGLEARRVSGKPLIAHVHSTERDRSGDAPNAYIADLERLGVIGADRIIAVSRYTAGRIVDAYRPPRSRIRVVHNAIDPPDDSPPWRVSQEEPLVLFAGRVTRQKGPDYFLEAAARVARERPDARFAVAGTGDRLGRARAHADALGLSQRVLFTGFLGPRELQRLYARADVYVLSSLSEPFGLTVLEALRQGTPAIVSRRAGVSEVVHGVLKVDFGDVEDLASKILSVLLFPRLREALSFSGRAQVRRLSWRAVAARCLRIYREVIAEGRTSEAAVAAPPAGPAGESPAH